MENNSSFGGIFRHNKKLEYCLLVIGLSLFMILGARGLEKISDRAVAAGEAHKDATISASRLPLTLHSSQANGLSSVQIVSVSSQHHANNQPKDGHSKKDVRDENSSHVSLQLSSSVRDATTAKPVKQSVSFN